MSRPRRLPAAVGADTLPEAEARILAALWAVHARHGRATVRQVAAEAGRSVGPTHRSLRHLAEKGLVRGIGDGTTGALRPAVWPVKVPARPDATAGVA